MFENGKVSLFLALKSLKGGSRGTLILTIMIISLVFVNLAFQPSIISGVVKLFNEQSIDYNYGNIVIEPRENQFYIDNVSSLQATINRIPGIRGSAPRTTIGATFMYKGKFLPSTLKSLDPRQEAIVTRIPESVIAGEFLQEYDRDQVVLGVLIAGNEDETKDKLESLGGVTVGENIDIDFGNGRIETYRVKGIVETQSIDVDYSVFVTNEEMESLLGIQDKATQIVVRLTEDNQGNEQTYRDIILSYGVSEKVKTYQDKAQGFVGDAIRSFDIINLISTIVSLIIAVVVIFIVIFINTVNKRRQIGILKAIGIDKQIIINSYVIQTLIICALGTVIGTGLFSLLTFYLNLYPLIFPGGAVRPVIDAGLITRSVISLFLVSTAAGFIPSWRVANEDILTAIRS